MYTQLILHSPADQDDSANREYGVVLPRFGSTDFAVGVFGRSLARKSSLPFGGPGDLSGTAPSFVTLPLALFVTAAGGLPCRNWAKSSPSSPMENVDICRITSRSKIRPAGQGQKARTRACDKEHDNSQAGFYDLGGLLCCRMGL